MEQTESTPSHPHINSGPARVSAAQIVVDGVVQALEEGLLAPGQRLVEGDLCTRFGVARNAVREALQKLASDGVVVLSRHKGAAIREISAVQALQTLEISELLFGLAARYAARGIVAPGAAALMRQALERLAAAQTKDDDRWFIKARGAFYAALLHIGQNQELQRILPTVQVHVLRAQYHLTSVHRRLHADFEAIGEAVLAGDPARAEQAGRAYLQHVRASLES